MLRNLYPRWIREGKLKQQQADHRIGVLESILDIVKAQPRPDQLALDAVPDLKGKNAVVVYFNTDADREEFIAALHEAKPGMRSVKI